MKPKFDVKRCGDGVYALWVHGFVDDTATTRTSIVLTVRASNARRQCRKELQTFCDKLQAVWDGEYGH